MKKKSAQGSLIGALVLSAGLSACANDQTKQDNTELMNRVAAAERAATAAQEAAARAQARADEALQAAQVNDQKIDRAFKKSQQK
jgi:hypothetical protein